MNEVDGSGGVGDITYYISFRTQAIAVMWWSIIPGHNDVIGLFFGIMT